jgi:hypothetical protein
MVADGDVDFGNDGDGDDDYSYRGCRGGGNGITGDYSSFVVMVIVVTGGVSGKPLFEAKFDMGASPSPSMCSVSGDS